MEKTGNTLAKVGAWAFIIGVVIALILGFLPPALQSIGVPVLVLMGIVVGFLNVTEKETSAFLMAAVSIMIALFTAGSAISAQLSTLGIMGTYFMGLLGSVNMFVFPATIVVAMKAIYNMAKDA